MSAPAGAQYNAKVIKQRADISSEWKYSKGLAVKIDNSIKPATGSNVPATRSRGPEPAAGDAKSSAAADVRLSGISSQIKASGEGMPIDAARISEIKQAISEGRFTVNAGAIADRLISTARELVNTKRQS